MKQVAYALVPVSLLHVLLSSAVCMCVVIQVHVQVLYVAKHVP
jgi:hypothetical protein